MWTHVSLNLEIVWDDVLWRLVAIWQDDDAAEPVALEESGRVPLGADGGPYAALSAACSAVLTRAAAGETRWRAD